MDFKCIITHYKYNNFINPFGNKTPLMFQISILYLYIILFEIYFLFYMLIIIYYILFSNKANSHYSTKLCDFLVYININTIDNPTASFSATNKIIQGHV